MLRKNSQVLLCYTNISDSREAQVLIFTGLMPTWVLRKDFVLLAFCHCHTECVSTHIFHSFHCLMSIGRGSPCAECWGDRHVMGDSNLPRRQRWWRWAGEGVRPQAWGEGCWVVGALISMETTEIKQRLCIQSLLGRVSPCHWCLAETQKQVGKLYSGPKGRCRHAPVGLGKLGEAHGRERLMWLVWGAYLAFSGWL